MILPTTINTVPPFEELFLSDGICNKALRKSRIVCVLAGTCMGEDEYVGRHRILSKFNSQTKAKIVVSNFYFSYPKEIAR